MTLDTLLSQSKILAYSTGHAYCYAPERKQVYTVDIVYYDNGRCYKSFEGDSAKGAEKLAVEFILKNS